MIHKENTEWDITEYEAELGPHCSGRNVAFEDELKTRYPGIYKEMETVSEPMLITDMNGKALAWYLPGAFSSRRRVRNALLRSYDTEAFQEQMWQSFRLLEPILTYGKDETNWRAASRYYTFDDAGMMKAGSTALSPAWYEQGHEVRESLVDAIYLRDKSN